MSLASQNLCRQCGLCCNGVLFADGQLVSGDDTTRLREIGLLLKRGKSAKFNQPCGALNGCDCRIYKERPQYCREFECRLLQDVAAGDLSADQALLVVQRTRKLVARVSKLLRNLGDENEHRPLASRFRTVTTRIHTEDCDAEIAESYGKLTIAMHQLNVLLSGRFLPRG